MQTVAELLHEAHNNLLKAQPDGAEHDESSCVICVDPELKGLGEEIVSDRTFTEQEVEDKIASATAALETKLKDEAAKNNEQAETEGKIKSLEGQVTELQAKLDQADIEKTAAVDRAESSAKEVTEIQEYLGALKTEAEAAEAFKSLCDERVGKVKDVAKFSDEHVEASRERWGRMEESDFAALLSDYEISAKSSKDKEATHQGAPATQVLETARRENGPEVNPLSFISDLTVAGVDPSKFH